MIANEAPAAAAVTQPITLTFDISGGTATGTLVSLDRGRPGPVVLLISGSGPLDRNSDMKKLAIGVMGQIAVHLGHVGLASFRYDKRGVGASGGDYLSTGFHDNLADAAAAVEMLRKRPEVDPEQIFVVGHSEGALIATELASTDPDLAGVALLAGTATKGEEVLRWQAQQVAATLPKPVKVLLRVLRQDIIRTQTKRLAQIKATTRDTERMQLVKINAKWFREFLAHDPGASLISVRVPVLAITGSKDLQVDADDVERICGLVPSDCSGHVVDDITHLLRREIGPPSVRTYKKQAKRPLDAEVLELVTNWIAERTTNESKAAHDDDL
jgi:pimeloyl-ACP methyl ester carboxylesterase